jgi:hypothetical protein
LRQRFDDRTIEPVAGQIDELRGDRGYQMLEDQARPQGPCVGAQPKKKVADIRYECE